MFFTEYNVMLSHRGACVSVDLSNFGSSFTHYTAMHHCAYERIGLSSSISIARFFHSLWCNALLSFFFHSNALPTSTTGVIIFHWNCVYVRCFSVPSLSVIAFLSLIPMHYPCQPLLLYFVNIVCLCCALQCHRALYSVVWAVSIHYNQSCIVKSSTVLQFYPTKIHVPPN